MAALALLPRRQISLATNLLVAIGLSFLAVQLVEVNRAPSGPVVIDWPLAGEWYVVHGGRSDLINAHYPSRLPLIGPEQADALDVVQVQNGRSSPPTWPSASRSSRPATESSPISPTPCPTCRSVPATTRTWKAITSSSTWVASVMSYSPISSREAPGSGSVTLWSVASRSRRSATQAAPASRTCACRSRTGQNTTLPRSRDCGLIRCCCAMSCSFAAGNSPRPFRQTLAATIAPAGSAADQPSRLCSLRLQGIANRGGVS